MHPSLKKATSLDKPSYNPNYIPRGFNNQKRQQRLQFPVNGQIDLQSFGGRRHFKPSNRINKFLYRMDFENEELQRQLQKHPQYREYFQHQRARKPSSLQTMDLSDSLTMMQQQFNSKMLSENSTSLIPKYHDNSQPNIPNSGKLTKIQKIERESKERILGLYGGRRNLRINNKAPEQPYFVSGSPTYVSSFVFN